MQKDIQNKGLVVHHHLGLGDHFVCNGLVNYIAKTTKCNIFLICKEQNYITVSSLYSENNNISVIPIKAYASEDNNEVLLVDRYAHEHEHLICRVGFEYLDPNNWDTGFYKQLGINFIERYRFFKLPKLQPEKLLPVPKYKYIFVHDRSSDKSFDLNIQSNLPRIVVKKTDTDNLLAYIRLIEDAEEIHCIDSSLLHLIDSMPCITNKLYYHDIRKHNPFFQISIKWDIIKY